jgi:hypothetical protein
MCPALFRDLGALFAQGRAGRLRQMTDGLLRFRGRNRLLDVAPGGALLFRTGHGFLSLKNVSPSISQNRYRREAENDANPRRTWLTTTYGSLLKETTSPKRREPMTPQERSTGLVQLAMDSVEFLGGM